MSGTLSSILGSGGIRPKSIINGYSTALAFALTTLASKAKQVLSGPMPTAGTLYDVLNLSGKGALSAYGFKLEDGTVRTVRIVITVDGTVVFDASGANTAVANQGVGDIVGSVLTSSQEFPLLYEQSLRIQASTSLSETDKLRHAYIYYTR